MNESASAPTLKELRDFWGCQDLVANVALRNGINLLANGRPVTPEAFAAVMGIAIEEARSYIDIARSMGVEVEDGAVVGAVLTLRPTHTVSVSGATTYTRGAASMRCFYPYCWVSQPRSPPPAQSPGDRSD